MSDASPPSYEVRPQRAVLLSQGQAIALAYVMQRWARDNPVARVDDGDCRAGGEAMVRVDLYLHPAGDAERYEEFFIGEDGELLSWVQDPGVPLDPNDSTTWTEGGWIELPVPWRGDGEW